MRKVRGDDEPIDVTITVLCLLYLLSNNVRAIDVLDDGNFTDAERD